MTTTTRRLVVAGKGKGDKKREGDKIKIVVERLW